MTAYATTADALLAAIIAAPEDDAPRLIYADWLDENAVDVVCKNCKGSGKLKVCHAFMYSCYENSDTCVCGGNDYDDCPTCHGTGRIPNGYAERAEFIKVQIELSQLCWRADCHEGRVLSGNLHTGERFDEPCPRCAPLRKREQELLHDHGAEWGPPDPDADFRKSDGTYARVGVGGRFRMEWRWSRGFVSGIRCTLADWLSHGRSIVRTQPVTRVEVSDKRPDFSDFARYQSAHGFWFWATMEERHPQPFIIPRELAEMGAEGFYETEAAAMEGLSAACLAWAKSA